jgi:hypothetical protein
VSSLTIDERRLNSPLRDGKPPVLELLERNNVSPSTPYLYKSRIWISLVFFISAQYEHTF